MARELAEVHVTTREGGPNNTLILIATHLPTGAVVQAMTHNRRQGKTAAYERLQQDAAVKAWMAEDV